jgi:hypothetical protein
MKSLCLIKNHTIKMSEGVERQLDTLLTAALDPNVWQIHDPAALSTWKESRDTY